MLAVDRVGAERRALRVVGGASGPWEAVVGVGVRWRWWVTAVGCVRSHMRAVKRAHAGDDAAVDHTTTLPYYYYNYYTT